MKLLVVNGAPRVGKDLFCYYAFINRGLVYPISTIDWVKEIALSIGWDGVKDERGRKFLSDLKDITSVYDDLPRKHVLEEIQNCCEAIGDNQKDAIFLIQAREPEDIKRWVEEHDAKTLFIYREGLNRTWGNHADDEVGNYEYDYYLNNGLDKFYWETRTVEFIDEIRREKWESHL